MDPTHYGSDQQLHPLFSVEHRLYLSHLISMKTPTKFKNRSAQTKQAGTSLMLVPSHSPTLKQTPALSDLRSAKPCAITQSQGAEPAAPATGQLNWEAPSLSRED